LIESEDCQTSCQETQPPDANPTDHRSFWKKYLDYIYQWDEFRTISLSTHTVNFIILFHLTCTFSFLYTTRMMSPIAFLTKSLEQMLNIGQLISLHSNDFNLFFSRK
jgi:hypothetical protein